MTPYYADDLVTIYHGDCREWSGKADAVLTDPPYGRDAVRLWDALATVAGDSLAPGGWLVAYSGQSCLPEVMAALDSRLVYRWALAAVYPGGEQMARIGDMTVLTGWKPVLAYRKPPFGSERGVHGRFTAGGRTGISDVLRRGGREKDAHEWAQPLGEASELIERFTRPPATILDPFAGSGTFLMAAKSLGRHAIGIEIEERYCEIAARRCSQEVLGLSFSPEVLAKSDGSDSRPGAEMTGFVRRSGRDSNPRGFRLAVFKPDAPVCGAWTVSVKQAGVGPRVQATVMATGGTP
jgi:site-specific DNA-methyltransferase (adenine-specific)